VGVKTAVKLIVEYGSISGIYDNLDQLKKKKKLHENLTASKEIVDLSRDLAAIDRHVDVEHALDDFALREFDTHKAFELFQSFEFKALATEFSQKADKSEKTYKIVHTTADMEHLASALEKNGGFAIDTETTALDPMLADLVGISVSYEKDTGFYIPVGHTHTGNIEMPEKEAVLRIFKPLLENPDIAKVGQNIKYDFIVLARYGIEIKGIVFDTMIASHLLNPGTRGHGLDRIAMNLFGHKMISYEEVTGKGKDQIGFQEVPLDLAADYAAEDADLTFMAYEALKTQIEDNGLTPLMETIEVPLICVLAKMEMAGIRVDTDVLGQMSREFEQELNSLEEKIYELAGEEFNINSSQQLGVILFEKLGLKAVKKTKKKTGYSTDVQVLTQLAETHEMPEKLLRYRTLGKLKSTYVDALAALVHPDTGRIHTSFNQTITVTGRLSSSNPNLQNIPIRKPEGKKIRQAFIPADGFTLISADYSQIELRLLAHCAKDPILIESFQNNEDIHARTALEVFQVLPGLVTDEMRSQAKAINFGIIYGMSAFRLSNELGISRKMAGMYIDNYFKRYAGVKKFIDETVEQTRETCEVSTLFGRKRRLDDIRSSNANLRNFAQRAAVNTPIQGSAADLIKLAMIKMQTALVTENMNSKMLLSVHDEIIFEAPEQETDKLITLAKQVMENVTPLEVPLKVNFGAGANWAEAEH
jgi:DNA polymerase-1